MKVAVIGATGLIGQHAARAVLRHAHTLRVLHRRGSDLSRLHGLAYEAVEADLDDSTIFASALTGVDAVIHCAGYYPRQPGNLDTQVLVATRQMENICEGALAAGIKKLVYVSAASILRKSPESPMADENMAMPERPSSANPFQVIKWEMEQVAKRYMDRGLAITIAIPSMVFGEYDFGPTAGRLITGIASGTLTRYIDCNRNIIAGADVGEGLMRCLALGKPAERYILGGTNVTMAELVHKIADRAQVAPPRRAPLALAYTVATVQQWRHRFGGKAPSVKASELRMIAAGKFLDTTKAKHELGFEAVIPLDDAIERTLSWFRNNGFLTSSLREDHP